jgi:hypothetical protein
MTVHNITSDQQGSESVLSLVFSNVIVWVFTTHVAVVALVKVCMTPALLGDQEL